jgi:putative (di)nucleoside polyphosphate hydrolase
VIVEGEYFRAGVGAVIIDDAGLVLAFERADVPGSWQLPQGGLLRGEEPTAAVTREIEEETGIAASDLDLLARYHEPLVYELPPELRRPKTGRGQVQYWFAFRHRGAQPGLALPEEGEFRNWRWVPFDYLLDRVVAFRKPLYERLRSGFAAHLDGGRS